MVSCGALFIYVSHDVIDNYTHMYINTYVSDTRSAVECLCNEKKRTSNMDYDFKVASKSVGNSKITSITACVGLHWLQVLKFTENRNKK